MTLIHRRGLIIGLASLLAAPAIVRASSLMPVRGILTLGGRGSPELEVAEWEVVQYKIFKVKYRMLDSRNAIIDLVPVSDTSEVRKAT